MWGRRLSSRENVHVLAVIQEKNIIPSSRSAREAGWEGGKGMKIEEKLKALPTSQLIQSSACQIFFFNPERFNASEMEKKTWIQERFASAGLRGEGAVSQGRRRVKSQSKSLASTTLLNGGSANLNCSNVKLKHPRLITVFNCCWQLCIWSIFKQIKMSCPASSLLCSAQTATFCQYRGTEIRAKL